jgi:methylenetetrahydrofolate reductase (NADPH)
VRCFLIMCILQSLYQGFENLIPRISRLSTLNPLAISVTWGAGGSTRERSIDLAGLTQSDYGIDTILHLTCTNMVPGMVDDALRVSCFPRIFGPLNTALTGCKSAGYSEYTRAAWW